MRINDDHPAIKLLDRARLSKMIADPEVTAGYNTPFHLDVLLQVVHDNTQRHNLLYMAKTIINKAKAIDIEKFISDPGWGSSFEKFYTATIITEEYTCLYGIFEWGINGIVFSNKTLMFAGAFVQEHQRQRYMIHGSPTEQVMLVRDFIRYLLFIELSEVETFETSPKNRRYKIGGEKVFNESGTKVIVIDAAWNKRFINAEFNVSGHLRWQPWGSCFEKRKLIWIGEYGKGGYSRKAGKDKFQIHTT